MGKTIKHLTHYTPKASAHVKRATIARIREHDDEIEYRSAVHEFFATIRSKAEGQAND